MAMTTGTQANLRIMSSMAKRAHSKVMIAKARMTRRTMPYPRRTSSIMA